MEKRLLSCTYGWFVALLAACPSPQPSPSAGLVDSVGRLNVKVTVPESARTDLGPEDGTELTLTTNADASVWSQTATAYPIEVHQMSGDKLASLLVLNPEFRITPSSSLPTGADTIELIGQVQSQALNDVVLAMAGIDPEGIGELIKGVWEIPAEAPLPAPLNFRLSFAPKAVPSGGV